MVIKINGNEFAITSEFGSVDYLHKTGHNGTDIAVPEGSELYSPTDGTVSDIVNYGNENVGKGVIIETEDGKQLIFGHLSDNSILEEGDKIQAGDLIGLSGNSGFSTGPHLHLGLKDVNGRFVNPKEFVGEELFQPSPSLGGNFNFDMSNSDIFNDALERFANSLSDMDSTLNLGLSLWVF